MPLPGAVVRALDLDDDGTLPPEWRGPAQYPEGDNAQASAYATFSRELLEEQKEVMDPLFLTWTQNLLFLAGLQHWAYDPNTGTFRLPRVPAWKERPVRNMILPYFKNIVAKVTKNRPATQCVPASTEADDIEASQLGDQVLRAKWQELNGTGLWKRAVGWAVTTGNAYVMPYWNERSGILEPLVTLVEAHVFDETGQPVLDEQSGAPLVQLVQCPCDEQGEPLIDPETGAYAVDAEPTYVDIGEVGKKVLSPFQVFVDPDAACDEDVTFFLVAEPMTLRRIRQMWPEVGDTVSPDDVTDFDRFDAMLAGAVAGADTHIAASRTTRDQSVPKGLVLHYYQKPDVDHPKGRYWCTAGDTLLEPPQGLPGDLWPPVVHLIEVDVPGRYHGEATMTALIGPQREYNEQTARIKQHEKLMAVGKWLVPRGSGVKRGQITAKEGEVIEHTPGLEPRMAVIAPLPNEVYRERERTAGDFETISGFHKISMGNPPPGVTSGRAFLTLQEADDTDIGPFTQALEQAVALEEWLTLQLIQKKYEDERLLRIAGQGRRFLVRSFKGADLTSIVDVVAQAGSAFPWSAVAKQSMMLDMATTLPMLFTDPETGQFDTQRFRELLPVGGIDAVGADSDVDRNEALREEEQIENWDGVSQLPDPTQMPWQSVAAHLRQHTQTLRNGSTETWEPHARGALIQHWQVTYALMQQKRLEAMAMELQAQAMAGGAGGPEGKNNAPKSEGGGDGGEA